MKATFWIVDLAYYIILFMLRLFCFLLPVCGLCAPSRERGGGWKKYFDRLLSSLVAYNGLFVSQYDFLNLEDSFVHFFIVKRIQYNVLKLRVFEMIESESSCPRLLYRIYVLYCAVYCWNKTLPRWQLHAQLGISKGYCTVAETSVRNLIVTTAELRRFYERFRRWWIKLVSTPDA